MKILIASDLHGSLESLDFLAREMVRQKPDHLVLLGDLVYHGPRNPMPHAYNTVGILTDMPTLASMGTPITAVKGNCDSEVDVEQMPFPMPASAWILADGLKIFASHGHRLPANPPLPGFEPGTVILRGHTHIPRGESEGGLHFWNPGSLSLPKGGFPATYGLYENGVFTVLSKAGETILRHEPQRD